ncbi:uncharacterized protein LOC130750265 [Actinidia eriantha]|uniref:uncharacterized protein LOC130750265 n=1 Tax=Actinidia eriantha TaxID=165200 RepID=UPI00259089FD|nr:uncharacterized protein LOC130750265 [Actinidia eriantha]
MFVPWNCMGLVEEFGLILLLEKVRSSPWHLSNFPLKTSNIKSNKSNLEVEGFSLTKPSPAATMTTMKGLLKGLRYLSQIFDNEKEEEMQIGYPTYVKHVAHIGCDGPSANTPSWMMSLMTLH